MAIKASIKASLQSLWANFSSFAAKKLALRKRALRGCLVDGENYLRLVSSNPLSASLFDPQEVQRIRDQAATQSKSSLHILDFSGFKRPFEGAPHRRVKRPRASPAPQQQMDPQPSTSKQVQPSSQRQTQQHSQQCQASFKQRRSANSRHRRERGQKQSDKPASQGKGLNF